MYYIFNRDELKYEPVEKPIKNSWILGVALLYVISIPLLMSTMTTTSESSSVESAVVTINRSKQPFSVEALQKLLIEINVEHPHIIMAQAIHETGNFESKIFKENNNLFGMKEAVVRIHTAKGTRLGHAYYDSWQESVIDYALYQASYLRNLTEQEYMQTLGEVYAEDPNYRVLVQGIVDSVTNKLF